jgi:hypothetical protein
MPQAGSILFFGTQPSTLKLQLSNFGSQGQTAKNGTATLPNVLTLPPLQEGTLPAKSLSVTRSGLKATPNSFGFWVYQVWLLK